MAAYITNTGMGKKMPANIAEAVYHYWASAVSETDPVEVPAMEIIGTMIPEAMEELTEREIEALELKVDKHMGYSKMAPVLGICTPRAQQLYCNALGTLVSTMKRMLLESDRLVEDTPIEVLSLTPTQCRVLRAYGMKTVGQLATATESQLIMAPTVGITRAGRILCMARDYITTRRQQLGTTNVHPCPVSECEHSEQNYCTLPNAAEPWEKRYDGKEEFDPMILELRSAVRNLQKEVTELRIQVVSLCYGDKKHA